MKTATVTAAAKSCIDGCEKKEPWPDLIAAEHQVRSIVGDKVTTREIDTLMGLRRMCYDSYRDSTELLSALRPVREKMVEDDQGGLEEQLRLALHVQVTTNRLVCEILDYLVTHVSEEEFCE